jgi:hypothetical protein
MGAAAMTKAAAAKVLIVLRMKTSPPLCDASMARRGQQSGLGKGARQGHERDDARKIPVWQQPKIPFHRTSHAIRDSTRAEKHARLCLGLFRLLISV